MSSESKFGFKDKEKAEETLQILESHDMQYRKLTVRGLLGRAKRVLTMTKAEDKLKNINEAIEVFENWLAENGGGASNKNSKTDTTEKVDTVPGLGFKDVEAAKQTLKILEGRDPEYQKFAVKGLIGSSKRVLAGTKNEDKIKAIKDAVQILEDFLDKFERDNVMRLNRAYLNYTTIEDLPAPKDKLAAEFLEAYGGSKAKGNYKHLRTMYPKDDDSTSWDIIRNKHVEQLLEEMKEKDEKLFKESGEPTEFHFKLISWAFSPQPDKVKKYVMKLDKEMEAKEEEEKKKSQKRKSNGDDEDGVSEKKRKSSE